MQITSKKELRFVILADQMMNRGFFVPSYKDKIKRIFIPDYIINYLQLIRKVSYYHSRNGIWDRIMFFLLYKKYLKLGVKLGFSIGFDTLGYGAVIPHYGTIVIGGTNRIGNYAVLHTSTCISDNGKIIGDGLCLATGAKITSMLTLGNNISVGANSLVNKSFVENNALIGGVPAIMIRQSEPWYIRDGMEYFNRVQKVERMRAQYNL